MNLANQFKKFAWLTGVFAVCIASAEAQDALFVDSNGNVGLGTNAPARQFHVVGSNATFRMDRDRNSAAFILVRTNSGGTPWKTFVVGADASGPNNGQFVINDLGAAVGGGGQRRLTITNNGDANFTGNVQANAFYQTSSIRFKKDVEPLSNSLAVVEQLRGVRFAWKDTDQPGLGLIAEEVASVLPEVVAHDVEDGQESAVNYSALVAVLVEAVKEQQAEIAAYRDQLAGHQAEALETQAELDLLKARVEEFSSAQAKIASLEAQVARFETLMVRLAQAGERLPGGEVQNAVLAQH
jgi:hypothetical protein